MKGRAWSVAVVVAAAAACNGFPLGTDDSARPALAGRYALDSLVFGLEGFADTVVWPRDSSPGDSLVLTFEAPDRVTGAGRLSLTRWPRARPRPDGEVPEPYCLLAETDRCDRPALLDGWYYPIPGRDAETYALAFREGAGGGTWLDYVSGRLTWRREADGALAFRYAGPDAVLVLVLRR